MRHTKISKLLVISNQYVGKLLQNLLFVGFSGKKEKEPQKH